MRGFLRTMTEALVRGCALVFPGRVDAECRVNRERTFGVEVFLIGRDPVRRNSSLSSFQIQLFDAHLLVKMILKCILDVDVPLAPKRTVAARDCGYRPLHPAPA